MKIEKISERQIRCTLSKKDLVDRELRLSELAYGTEKAKELFRDMMQQASYEFGFEADDIPLMIEAIPVSSECLVLVVTKVEDPDELDTRFSKFTDDLSEDFDEDELEEEDEFSEDEEVVNCFGKIDDLTEDTDDSEDSFIPLPESISGTKKGDKKVASEEKEITTKIVFSFNNLEDVIKASSIVIRYFKGVSSLYKNPVNSIYYLSISKTMNSKEDFSRVCGIMSEYGKLERTTYSSLYYYDEHYDVILDKDAISTLSVL